MDYDSPLPSFRKLSFLPFVSVELSLDWVLIPLPYSNCFVRFSLPLELCPLKFCFDRFGPLEWICAVDCNVQYLLWQELDLILQRQNGDAGHTHLVSVCLQGTADTTRLKSTTMHSVSLKYFGVLCKRYFEHWQAHSLNFTFSNNCLLSKYKIILLSQNFGLLRENFKIDGNVGYLDEIVT